MGLNLDIKRIIITSIYKNISKKQEIVSPNEILQIGGRAGRFLDQGYVCGISEEINNYIKFCFNKKQENVNKIGIYPLKEHFYFIYLYIRNLKFNEFNYIDENNYIYIKNAINVNLKIINEKNIFFYSIKYFIDYFKADKYYFISESRYFMDIVRKVSNLRLRFELKYDLCIMPIKNCKHNSLIMLEFDKICKEIESNYLVKIDYNYYKNMIKSLNKEDNLKYLSTLEEIYNIMENYLWWSNKYPESKPQTPKPQNPKTPKPQNPKVSIYN